MKENIRIGLLVDSDHIPAWVAKMLQSIKESGVANIVLVIKKINQPGHVPVMKRIFSRRNSIAYSMLRRFENFFFKFPNDAFKTESLGALLDESTHILEVAVQEKKFSDIIEEEDLLKIKAFDLDVIIRIGFRILRGDILRLPKYGVWSYHHGDNYVNRGGPAGVWELIRGWPTTGVILQILTEDLDGGLVLCRSLSSTDKNSIRRNLNNFYWKAVSFIPRKIKELYNSGGDAFMAKVKTENSKLDFYSEQLFTTPGNTTTFGYVIRKFFETLKEKLQNLTTREQWFLQYRFSPEKKISTSFFRFKSIKPPPDRFWADPHVFLYKGEYYIFLEELIYSKIKGHISVIKISPDGTIGECTIVMDTKEHLSYPFVFEDKGTIYMIPESQERKTVELYSSVEFPLKWKLEKNLLSGIEAFDATILFANELYWMFTNVRENKGASSRDELFLYFTEDLINGEWKPHPMNPIVSDVTRARPAGRIFTLNENLYRPSQNSAGRYGYGININRIVKLSETEYEEVLESAIKPNWLKEIHATHTLSYNEGLTVIDALRRVRKKWIFW